MIRRRPLRSVASLRRRRVQGACNAAAASLVLGAGVLLAAPEAGAEIRVWVDDDGVTHFSDDPERAPEAAPSAESAAGFETLGSVWSDGLVGPPIEGGRESSFGDDRVARLLRGALEDLRRGEVARADSTLRGVVRLAPERPEAHWYLSGLARARGRFSTAEHHLRRFLDTAGPTLEPWRDRARARLDAIGDERRLADPEAGGGARARETNPGDHSRRNRAAPHAARS
ncbi:MAG: DUF4124 domain-containing protein, partial [Myxococcota bacterium]